MWTRRNRGRSVIMNGISPEITDVGTWSQAVPSDVRVRVLGLAYIGTRDAITDVA